MIHGPRSLVVDKVRDSRANSLQHSDWNLRPRSSTGVTGAVSLSDLDFIEGVGLRMGGLASRIDGLLDWLAEAVGGDIVSALCFCHAGVEKMIVSKRDHKYFWHSADFWHSAAILVWCPWILCFLPFNRDWVTRQSTFAFVAVCICLSFGGLFFKESFPGVYFFVCIMFAFGAFFGPRGVAIWILLILYIFFSGVLPYPLNELKFLCWVLLTGSGVAWATRNTLLLEREKNILGEDQPNKILRPTIKTGLTAFVFFGVISLVVVGILFGDSDFHNMGMARYHDWYEN